MNVETFEQNGYTVKIQYDEDSSYANPRQDTNLGLFLGFPHRSYDIGDARFYAEDYADEDGNEPANQAELIAAIKAKHGSRVVLPVGMIDHSGVHYYIGGGAHWSDSAGWDSGTCGFIFDTTDGREECGGGR